MKVRCLILDVDGVMTEGGIIYTATGDEIKVFKAQSVLCIEHFYFRHR